MHSRQDGGNPGISIDNIHVDILCKSYYNRTVKSTFLCPYVTDGRSIVHYISVSVLKERFKIEKKNLTLVNT